MMLLLSGSKSLCIYNPSIPHTTIIWQLCCSTTGHAADRLPPFCCQTSVPAASTAPTPHPKSPQCSAQHSSLAQGWGEAGLGAVLTADAFSGTSGLSCLCWMKKRAMKPRCLLARGWLCAGCGHQQRAYLKNNSRIRAELDPNQRPASLQSNLTTRRKGRATKTKQSLQASKTSPWIAATCSPAERTREQPFVPHVQHRSCF